MCNILIAISYLAHTAIRTVPFCIPISKPTYHKLVIQAKLQAMLDERGMSLNELFLLAIYKTTVELDFQIERKNYILWFIEKRFKPEFKFFRFFKRLVETIRCDNKKLGKSRKKRLELRDEIRKKVLFNKRADRL
jgi:hypothetical protein